MVNKKVKIIPVILISSILLSLLLIMFLLHNRGINFFTAINYLTVDEYSDNYNLPSQKHFNVNEYRLKIKIDMEKEAIEGNLVIEGKLLRAMDTIVLNLNDNMNITNLTCNEKKIDFIHSDDKIFLLKEFNKDETVNIEIGYYGKPKNYGLGGFVFEEFDDSLQTVYVINEPQLLSTWMPCNDLPSDKALLKIDIENDSNYVSVSNGILADKIKNGDRIIYKWETVYPISPYLITIYSAPYVEIEESMYNINNKKLNFKYYIFEPHLEPAIKDFSVHKEMLSIFESLFGEYPFIDEKYGVAEFMWNYGAMENQTIVGIGEKFTSGFFLNKDILAHELAHHWWGNSVSVKEWKDIWLNEGFARYSEALYHESSSGRESLFSTMRSYLSENYDGKIYDPDNLFSQTIYNKGAYILHMLRFETGDSKFFELLRNYHERYKYKNASISDFEELCKSITGTDYKWFFEQWIYINSKMPEIEYGFGTARDTTIIWFNQKQESKLLYNLPLVLELTDRENIFRDTVRFFSKDTLIRYKTGFIPEKIKLDPENWLFMKAEYNDGKIYSK